MIPDWISHEPLAWTALFDCVVVALITFGVPITPDQKTALSAVVVAASVLFARSKVTPTAKIEENPAAAQALKQAEAKH